MKRFISFFNLLFMLLFITVSTGCFKDGENSVTQELLRPVSVFISGNVVSADTGEAVAGVQVRIQRLLGDNTTSFIQDGASDLLTVTDASGNFEFSGAIELEVDTYQHFLHISDPSNNYYTNDSQVVYSIRDAELVYKDVRVINRNPKTTTIVSGTVRNVLSDAAVSGASIRLTHATDSTIMRTATTAADGTFAIESVDVSEYTLKIDGSALSTSYVVEDSTVKLVGGEINDLGSIRIAPAINTDDLRVVLQWNQSAGVDLDIQYTFPKPNFDFNHCGIQTLDMGASDFSVNPAYGFATGTAYWPENMGGEARLALTDRDEPGRYTLDKDAGTLYTDSYWPGTENKFIVGGQTIAELDRNSSTGSTPEVLTIHKKNFLAAYPDYMSYYYGGTASTRLYPAALGVFTVKCSTSGASIYNSGAVVKVYQGNKYLGKHSLSDMTVSDQESNKKYWTVLLVEQGYKTPTNTWVKPSSDNDIYFRVVPYGSQSATLEVTPPSPGFYFNVTELPYNVTYTAYMDSSPYLETIPPNLKHMKMIGTSTGMLYSMFSNSSMGSVGRNYVWRTKWHGDFKARISSIGINEHGFTQYYVYLDGNPSSEPWTGSKNYVADPFFDYNIWTTDLNQLSTTDSDDYGTYNLPTEFTRLSLENTFVKDEKNYFDVQDNSYTAMLATSSGPQKYMGGGSNYTDGPTGEVNILCPLLNKDAISNGRVLVAGLNKLYVYNSNEAATVDQWDEIKWITSVSDEALTVTGSVNVSDTLVHTPVTPGEVIILVGNSGVGSDDGSGNITGSGISGSGTINYTTGAISFILSATPSYAVTASYEYSGSVSGVSAMVSLKSNFVGGSAYSQAIIARAVGGGWEVGTLNATSNVEIADFGANSWNSKDINDLKIVKMGPYLYCYYATSQGVYYRRAHLAGSDINTYPPIKLSSLLDGINVLKIVDYDGKIGLLTENNGFIVGPYPPLKWEY